jgi:hypothetical protein
MNGRTSSRLAQVRSRSQASGPARRLGSYVLTLGAALALLAASGSRAGAQSVGGSPFDPLNSPDAGIMFRAPSMSIDELKREIWSIDRSLAGLDNQIRAADQTYRYYLDIYQFNVKQNQNSGSYLMQRLRSDVNSYYNQLVGLRNRRDGLLRTRADLANRILAREAELRRPQNTPPPPSGDPLNDAFMKLIEAQRNPYGIPPTAAPPAVPQP